MFTLIKERFYSRLETYVAHETFLINSNPIIMKRLCERDPKYLKYAKGKSISPELIETALKHVGDIDRFILNEILYQGNDIEHSSVAMKYFCEMNGTYFTASRGPGTTFENFLIALNHPDPFKKLNPNSIIGRNNFSFDHISEDELKKFCEYDGRFLYGISYKDITIDILKIALNHPDPNKRPNLIKVPAIRHNISIMDKLIELDGQYFIYALNEAANLELLNKALNHPDPNKRLSFDRIPKDFNSYFNYQLIKRLMKEDERWIKYVYIDTITSKGFIKKLKIDKDYIPTLEMMEKFKNDPEVLKTFYEEIEKGHYTLDQVENICSVYLDRKIIEDESFQKITEYLCQKQNVDYDFFKHHITKAISLNDEVLKTLFFEFLQERYHKIYESNNYERLYSLIAYSYIQESIIRIGKTRINGLIDYELGDKKLELLSKILNLPNKTNPNQHLRNWSSYYMKVINSFEEEPELYTDIASNLDQIDEQLLKLLASYATGQHHFIIKDINDLKKYNLIRDEWIKKNINSKDIDDVRDAVLENNLGISINIAKELHIPYTEGILQGKEYFHPTIVEFFTILNRIMTEEKIELLREELLKEKPKINLKDKYAVDLRGIIKKQYIKAYNATLFKTDDKFPDDVIKGVKLYNAAGSKGDKPFNISLTVLGAYTGFDPLREEYNYKADWLRPKILNHGICTSYIANNNIGVAPTNYSILGFTDYDDEALLLSGPTDIYSVNESFDITGDEDEKSKYLMPSLMIDNTRNNHNEMVIERKIGQEKRMPSYVVLVCNNYSKTKRKYLTQRSLGRYFGRKDNLYGKEKSEGDLLHHAIQTAKDFNIPIVIVEREKIALQEYLKIRQSLNLFKDKINFNRQEIKSFYHELIINYENNYSGNRIYNRDIAKRYFSHSQAKDILETIKDEISFQLNNNPITGLIMLDELEDISNKEKDKGKNIQTAFDHEASIKFCKTTREKLMNSINVPESIYYLYNNSFKDDSYLSNYDTYLKPFISIKQFLPSDIKKELTQDLINQFMVTVNEIEEINLFGEITEDKKHIENVLLFSIIIAKKLSLSKDDIDLLLLSCLYSNIPKEHKPLLDKYLIRNHPEDKESIEMIITSQEKNNEMKKELPKRIKTISNILEDANNLDKTRFLKDITFNQDLLHYKESHQLIKFSAQLNECYLTNTLQESKPIKKGLSIFKKI